MPKNFSSINELDMGGGIDAQSPETNLQESHASDIRDMDPQARGSIAKRKGFECLGGSLPLRVTEVSQEGGEICFTLQDAIDTTQIGDRPILVSGISYNSGTMTYDRVGEAETWFNTSIVQVQRTLVAPSTPLIITAAEHGFSTANLQVQVKEVTAAGNEHIFTTSTIIDDVTFDVTINHTSTSDVTVYVVIIASDEEAGVIDISTFTGDQTTLSIPAPTHQLSHTQLVPTIYFKVFGSDDWEEIVEDSMTISDTGDVSISLASAPGVLADSIKVILRAAEISNVMSGTIASLATASITITDTPTDFQFVSVWVESGTDLVRVIPNSITHDDTAQTTEIEFINPGSSATFEIYWEDATLESTRVCVSGILTDVGEWENPTSVVWGLIDYHTLPTSSADQGRALFAHHLSTYAAQGQKFPLSALMGSPMRLNTDSVPNRFPRMSSRVSGDQVLAPFFSDLGEGSRVESSAGNQGRLDVVSITWTTGTSMEVVVSVPDMVVNSLALSSDELTLTNCGRSKNEGTFSITSVVAGVDELTFTVTNPSREDGLDDETDTGAFAAIYTDSLILQDQTIFFPGDQLQAATLTDESLEVIGQSGTLLHLRNVRSRVEMPGGLRVRAVRTNAYVIPLRDDTFTRTVESFVCGDSVTVGGEARRIRLSWVRATDDLACTFTSSDEITTVTVGSTAGLSEGRKALIHDDSSDFAGEHVILSIPSSTTFTIAQPTSATTGSGTLIGHTVELDESVDSISDDSVTKIERPERWFPIPTTSGEVTPWRASDASNQPLLRSGLSRDSAFFAGTDDPIFKFDGTSMSRAGIPRLEIDLFLNKDTAAAGKIALSNPFITPTASSGSKFQVAAADIRTFTTGDRVEDSRDGSIYTVEQVDDVNNRVVVDRTISGTGAFGQLTKTSKYTYYMRLNMIDANGGLVGSAAVGSNDLIVEIGEDAAIYLRSHNFPKLDSFDFDRMELEIFRTKKDTAGPFYRLTTLPLRGVTDAYIDFEDTTLDDTLVEADLDPISTALAGVELGTQWEGPLPSKYVAAISNRVIFANCRSWPMIDLRFKRSGVLVDAANANGLTLSLSRDNTQTVPDAIFEAVNSSASETITAGVATTIVGANEPVYLFTDSDNSSLVSCGWFYADGAGQIDTGSTSFTGSRKLVRASVAGHIPVFVNDLTSATKDFNWPKQNLVGGATASVEGQMSRRLAGAINWWQSTLTDAWLTAAAGGDFEFGQLVLKTPRHEATLFETKVTLNGADLNVFANGFLRDDAEQVSGLIKTFPSRILSSEANFPDIFNAPDVDLDVLSRGVIDVNPDDGEEITGITSFFGESTSSSSALQSAVVVFKESSIYIVDPDTESVQRLQTEGKGCTVPGSIVPVRGGIMFANLSGIYLLTTDFTINFVGRTIDRVWKSLGTSNFADAAATLKNSENKWMLRVGDTTIVYDTTRTYEQGKGSFTTYTNHDSLAWSNFGSDHLWASERGSVLVARNLGTDKDYLDEGQAVTCQLTWRPLSFGDATIRKAVLSIFSHFRVLTAASAVTVSTQVDMDGEFEPCDTNNVTEAADGFASRTLVTLVSSPPTPRGLFFSIRWENSEAVPFEISGFGLRVAGLTGRGSLQAKNS